MSPQLIVALDFADENEAWELVKQLSPVDCALKVGSEMFTLFGTHFVKGLVARGFKVFLDLKFHDIPNTVAQACLACAKLGVWMINLHASGGLVMMQTARKALDSFAGPRPLLIAVTVLTSMGEKDLDDLGLQVTVDEQVTRLALLASKAGLDGVVCSAFEVPIIKDRCGESFLTITPGIRLDGDKANDQLRIMTPSKALEYGSDFLVVGRSITAAKEPARVVAELLSIVKN